MIAQVSGRLAAKQADRVVVQTAGGVGYEIAVPLGVMEQLPPVGESVSCATELVVREDGWALYGFRDESERRWGAGGARAEHRVIVVRERHWQEDRRAPRA